MDTQSQAALCTVGGEIHAVQLRFVLSPIPSLTAAVIRGFYILQVRNHLAALIVLKHL